MGVTYYTGHSWDSAGCRLHWRLSCSPSVGDSKQSEESKIKIQVDALTNSPLQSTITASTTPIPSLRSPQLRGTHQHGCIHLHFSHMADAVLIVILPSDSYYR
ncbi:hypothetical protein COCON_G00236500 [Conger conger]|uniref:Uncharacterized protein n=1 Tax=Conger conger TaxID=82655 RepID=A0A9Q1HMH3_CONCO|nr:hypothetical protein COCON_G00236500 [Conger conger]